MNSENIKIIPLGGVEEIGINCTIIEYENEITIIDAGLGFPLADYYGIDYLIPNISYLKQNKHKIQGIIITHGHLDHIGALSYIIEELDFPEIFTSQFASELIKNKLQEKNLLKNSKIRIINKDSKLVSGKFEISFFGVTHSIPESLGVVIKTPAGNIVHTGDFKFDNSPMNEPVSEYVKIAKTGSEGVLALLSDSTNSFKSGHSKSEKVIYDTLRTIVENSSGRVIVATFSSLLTRLYQLITIALEENRKVAIAGRSMENVIEIARKLKYINVPDNLFININKAKTLPDNKVLILATGAQGEHFAALARMARGSHKVIDIKEGDTVILSASIIPGNDMLVQNLIDDLSERGANVYHKAEIMDLHSSGHGYQEDQKLMINLTKPKYFIPVHGYSSFLHKHAKTAQNVGIKKENIIVSKRGQIIELNKNNWKFAGKVISDPVFVSGLGVGDIGQVVLKERTQLANYGVVIIVITFDKDKKQKPDIQVITKGFIYIKSNLSLLEKIKQETEFAINETKNLSNNKELEAKVKAKIYKLLYTETEREPMILTLIY